MTGMKASKETKMPAMKETSMSNVRYRHALYYTKASRPALSILGIEMELDCDASVPKRRRFVGSERAYFLPFLLFFFRHEAFWMYNWEGRG